MIDRQIVINHSVDYLGAFSAGKILLTIDIGKIITKIFQINICIFISIHN